MRQETILKVAGLLRPGEGLTIREVSRQLGIGYRPAYLHLHGMAKEGMVRMERVGMAKLCRLNLSSEACRQVLAEVDRKRKEKLFMAVPALRAVLEGLVGRLAEAWPGEIHTMMLFGSYAKGTAGKRSDVDLLFSTSSLRNRRVREGIERECAGYRYSHNLTVSPVITDIAEFKKMVHGKGVTVGKEAAAGIPLYGAEAFWRWVV